MMIAKNKFSLNREMVNRVAGSTGRVLSGWLSDDFNFMRDAMWHISELVIEASDSGASSVDPVPIKQRVKELIRKECGYGTVMWLISWVVWSYRVTEWIRLAIDILKEIEDSNNANN